MTDPARLYEADWYAWTEDQARTLRAWPVGLRPNALDIEHIAEEIEGLGKERRAQVKGLMRGLVEHLLKLEFLDRPDSRAHWRAEVRTFRQDIADRMNRDDEPTLWSQREDIYRGEWPKAVDLYLDRLEDRAMRRAAHADLSGEEPRYDLDAEVLNPGWHPGADED